MVQLGSWRRLSEDGSNRGRPEKRRLSQSAPSPAAPHAQPVRAARLPRLPALSPKIIHMDDPHQDERRRVEAFLEAAYRQAYGVHLEGHYPTLMSVQDADGRIYAAVGFRYASQASLFLEQYLDAPVEIALSSAWGLASADRADIAEVGNLASDGRGATLFLFLALAEHLRGAGCLYAVATATRELRGIFAKTGIDAVQLASADASRLSDAGRAWGAYYRTDPIVLAGSIGRSWPPLASIASANPRESALRSRLHFCRRARS